MSVTHDVACGECGCRSFVIWNYDDDDLPGTVRVDGSGEVVGVEGLLACADCGEVFDPDQVTDQPRPELRLLDGGQ